MNLKYEIDLAREADLLKDETIKTDKAAFLRLLLTYAAVLVATVALLYFSNAPTGLMVSVTLAVATLCVIRVIGFVASLLHLNLVYLTATVEWFGKQQLGEDEET